MVGHFTAGKGVGSRVSLLYQGVFLQRQEVGCWERDEIKSQPPETPVVRRVALGEALRDAAHGRSQVEKIAQIPRELPPPAPLISPKGHVFSRLVFL